MLLTPGARHRASRFRRAQVFAGFVVPRPGAAGAHHDSFDGTAHITRDINDQKVVAVTAYSVNRHTGKGAPVSCCR